VSERSGDFSACLRGGCNSICRRGCRIFDEDRGDWACSFSLECKEWKESMLTLDLSMKIMKYRQVLSI